MRIGRSLLLSIHIEEKTPPTPNKVQHKKVHLLINEMLFGFYVLYNTQHLDVIFLPVKSFYWSLKSANLLGDCCQ